MIHSINSLRPRQIRRRFADNILKCNFIPALVQIMVCRRPGDKPLSERMMVRWATHICVIRPKWVSRSIPSFLIYIYIYMKQFTEYDGITSSDPKPLTKWQQWERLILRTGWWCNESQICYIDNVYLNESLNSFPPWQNGRHFLDDIIRCIFVNKKFRILIKISSTLFAKGLIDNNPALV